MHCKILRLSTNLHNEKCGINRRIKKINKWQRIVWNKNPYNFSRSIAERLRFSINKLESIGGVYWKKIKKQTCLSLYIILYITYITLINIYACNAVAPKNIKQILTDIKGGIDNNAIIVGDFHTSLTSMNRSTRKKIRKQWF